MSDDRKYARVYWSVMDDPKFDGIREDVRHFGSWSFLLVLADMAWPAPAYVPSLVPRASFRALVAAGLIDELSGGRFRIHGLQTERIARSNAASNAAAVRWHGKGNAETMPRRAETSKAEQRLDETVPGREGTFPAIGSRSIGLVKPTGTER